MMNIAIGLPTNIENPHGNGFITAFQTTRRALDARYHTTLYAPQCGDIVLETKPSEIGDNLIARYTNTIELSKEFAEKVQSTAHDRVIAYTNMGLFLNEPYIYYTSNIPYKKILQLVATQYPVSDPHFQKLLQYYQYIADREGEHYQKAQKIITHSLEIKQSIIQEHSIDPNKIFYVPRPIEPIGNPLPLIDSDPQSMKIILMPAEISIRKGIRSAIETMKILKTVAPTAVLVICGRMNAYEQDYIRELLAEAKGKANIIQAGFLPKEKFFSYIQQASCVFMPFCFDESPIALNECLAHGVPVVTNTYAGYSKDIIDQFGYCAEYGNTEDYAKGLLKLLQDSEYNKQKRLQVQGLYEKFTFKEFATQLYSIIEGDLL